MSNRNEQHHRSPRDVPPVGRPKGAVWRSLQADGVVWEGQVLLVGGEVDLAARMIVTHRRVVFVRGGEIVLEVPRGWLRQEPVLRRDGVLDLFVATPDSNPFDEPMRVPLRMREGHPAAGHIIAMLAPGGVRRIAPDTVSAIERAREASPAPSYGGFWDGIDPLPAPKRDAFLLESQRLSEDPGAVSGVDDLPPIEPPERLVRVPSTPPSPQRQAAASSYTIAGLAPHGQRRSPWSLILRLCALMILLGTAAALGAGRLNIQIPGSAPNAEAVLTAPPTEDAAAPEDQAIPADVEVEGNEPASALSPDDLTAIAVGVGGPAVQPTAEVAAGEDDDAAASDLVVAPTKPAIPTPAPPSTPAVVDTGTPELAVATVAATSDEGSGSEEAAGPATAPETPAESAIVEEPAEAELMIDSVRLTFPIALRDESLPKYGLPPGSGEWVLLVAELTNEGDAAATLPMSDFQLLDRATETTASLDGGTGVIASLAGITPGRDAADVISLEPGASTEVLLLYLLPSGSGDDLALRIGESSLDLAPSLS